MNDVADILLRFNLGATLAIFAVVALRPAIRKWGGVHLSYALWALVPILSIVMTLPGHPELAPSSSAIGQGDMLTPKLLPGWIIPFALAVWVAGLLASISYIGWRQLTFADAVRRGAAGPATAGLLKLRLVLPANFDDLYDAEERQLILAHERGHMRRQDPRINALIALFRCVNWFNPAVHLFARLFREDQELRCDALVMREWPGAHRTYARAMVKTQLSRQRSPFAAYWPAETSHPLARRIQVLGAKTPNRRVQQACVALIVGLTLMGSAAAWALGPSRLIAKDLDQLGSVIRVKAAVVAPDGQLLASDVSMDGSPRALRTTHSRRSGTPYGLWTGARQQGNRIWIQAALTRNGRKLGIATALADPGQTQRLEVLRGVAISVTSTMRRESPQEAFKRLHRRHGVVRIVSPGARTGLQQAKFDAAPSPRKSA